LANTTNSDVANGCSANEPVTCVFSEQPTMPPRY